MGKTSLKTFVCSFVFSLFTILSVNKEFFSVPKPSDTEIKIPNKNISLFFTYVRNMFVAHGGTILLSAYLDSKMIFLIVMGVLFAGVLQKIYEKVRVHSAGKIPANGMVTVPRMIACMVIFWLSVAALVNNSYNPFIYFRF